MAYTNEDFKSSLELSLKTDIEALEGILTKEREWRSFQLRRGDIRRKEYDLQTILFDIIGPSLKKSSQIEDLKKAMDLHNDIKATVLTMINEETESYLHEMSIARDILTQRIKKTEENLNKLESSDDTAIKHTPVGVLTRTASEIRELVDELVLMRDLVEDSSVKSKLQSHIDKHVSSLNDFFDGASLNIKSIL